MPAPSEADDADERRLYGRAQHEERGGTDCVEETTYGKPQHESDVDWAFDFELVRFARSPEEPELDRRGPRTRPPAKVTPREVSDV